MAGNQFFQDLDPISPPDQVTPHDGPGDARGYAMVTPSGVGTAPYSISAPQDIAGITAAAAAARELSGGGEGTATGAGFANVASPRQSEALAILDSPQGAGAMNVFAGFPDYESSDVSPGPNMENPIQGHTADYPGTTQGGVPQFMDGLGGDTPGSLPGVPPESGSMDGPGGMYPGTTQPGVTQYG